VENEVLIIELAIANIIIFIASDLTPLRGEHPSSCTTDHIWLWRTIITSFSRIYLSIYIILELPIPELGKYTYIASHVCEFLSVCDTSTHAWCLCGVSIKICMHTSDR
jgi:hypothetical protein